MNTENHNTDSQEKSHSKLSGCEEEEEEEEEEESQSEEDDDEVAGADSKADDDATKSSGDVVPTDDGTPSKKKKKKKINIGQTSIVNFCGNAQAIRHFLSEKVPKGNHKLLKRLTRSTARSGLYLLTKSKDNKHEVCSIVWFPQQRPSDGHLHQQLLRVAAEFSETFVLFFSKQEALDQIAQPKNTKTSQRNPQEKLSTGTLFRRQPRDEDLPGHTSSVREDVSLPLQQTTLDNLRAAMEVFPRHGALCANPQELDITCVVGAPSLSTFMERYQITETSKKLFQTEQSEAQEIARQRAYDGRSESVEEVRKLFQSSTVADEAWNMPDRSSSPSLDIKPIKCHTLSKFITDGNAYQRLHKNHISATDQVWFHALSAFIPTVMLVGQPAEDTHSLVEAFPDELALPTKPEDGTSTDPDEDEETTKPERKPKRPASWDMFPEINLGLLGTILDHWNDAIQVIACAGTTPHEAIATLNEIAGTAHDATCYASSIGHDHHGYRLWTSYQISKSTNCLNIFLTFDHLPLKSYNDDRRAEMKNVVHCKASLLLPAVALSNIFVLQVGGSEDTAHAQTALEDLLGTLDKVKPEIAGHEERLFSGHLLLAINQQQNPNAPPKHKLIGDKIWRDQELVSRLHNYFDEVEIVSQENLARHLSYRLDPAKGSPQPYEVHSVYFRNCLKMVLNSAVTQSFNVFNLTVKMKAFITEFTDKLENVLRRGVLPSPAPTGIAQSQETASLQQDKARDHIVLAYLQYNDDAQDKPHKQEAERPNAVPKPLDEEQISALRQIANEQREGKARPNLKEFFQRVNGNHSQRLLARVRDAQEWLETTLQDNPMYFDALKMQCVRIIAQAKASEKLCGLPCSHGCYYWCLLPSGHSEDHDCLLFSPGDDHLCGRDCDTCRKEQNRSHTSVEKIDVCVKPAGHQFEASGANEGKSHLCNRKTNPHKCPGNCRLKSKSRNCEGDCEELIFHDEGPTYTPHRCKVDEGDHLCGRLCDLLDHDGCSHSDDSPGYCTKPTIANDHTDHMCGNRHRCRRDCVQPGACFNTDLDGEEPPDLRSKLACNAFRRQCKIKMDVGKKTHVNQAHRCEASFHTCDKTCRDCGKSCVKKLDDHHGNLCKYRHGEVKDIVQVLDKTSDPIAKRDTPNRQTCEEMCKDAGDSHSHVTKATEGHVDIDGCRLVNNKLHWSHNAYLKLYLAAEDPVNEQEDAEEILRNYNQCPQLCPIAEHTESASEDSAPPPKCSGQIYHKPFTSTQQFNNKGFISEKEDLPENRRNEKFTVGHHFPCNDHECRRDCQWNTSYGFGPLGKIKWHNGKCSGRKIGHPGKCNCGDTHACKEKCDAEGCDDSCTHEFQKGLSSPVEDVHVHECSGWGGMPGFQKRKKCGGRCHHCGDACRSDDHFHNIKMQQRVAAAGTVHYCSANHLCQNHCQAPGRCFRNSPSEYQQTDKRRKKCHRNIDVFSASHTAPCYHDDEHFCSKQCQHPGCWKFCILPFSHLPVSGNQRQHFCDTAGHNVSTCSKTCNFPDCRNTCKLFSGHGQSATGLHQHYCALEGHLYAKCNKPCKFPKCEKMCSLTSNHQKPGKGAPAHYCHDDGHDRLPCTKKCGYPHCSQTCSLTADHPTGNVHGLHKHFCQQTGHDHLPCVETCRYPKCTQTCSLPACHPATRDDQQNHHCHQTGHDRLTCHETCKHAACSKPCAEPAGHRVLPPASEYYSHSCDMPEHKMKSQT